MNARLISLAVLAATLATAGFSADEAPAKKPARNEALRAKMVEDAKIQAAKPTTPAATKPNSSPAKAPGAPAEPAAPASASASATATPTEPSPPTKASEEPATVLPQIEVNRSKLHPLARELYEKEKEIAREKELTKPTELDKALNHPKISVPLFGGQSTSSRASVASERTSLLQAEADLIEEIGRAKTKEQKAELRLQLDALKKIRRELEHTIR